jgi:DNA-binding NarL/FixJ family response regulator
MQTSVAVLASDPVTADGVAASLRGRPEIQLCPPDQRRRADVVLLLTHQVGDETLEWMRCTAAESVNPDMRIVLVADDVREHHLFRAVEHGLFSVLSRREAGVERIVAAIGGVAAGRAEMPRLVLGRLVEQVRTLQRDVLAPNGLTTGGLQTREVEVLRLLADGLDTVEIAEQLNYSERTIKNVIHGMMSRLKLRNRSHAVAFGLRCGAF